MRGPAVIFARLATSHPLSCRGVRTAGSQVSGVLSEEATCVRVGR